MTRWSLPNRVIGNCMDIRNLKQAGRTFVTAYATHCELKVYMKAKEKVRASQGDMNFKWPREEQHSLRRNYLAREEWPEACFPSLPWMDIAPLGIAGTSPCASMLQLLAMRLPPAVRQKNADSSIISALL